MAYFPLDSVIPSNHNTTILGSLPSKRQRTSIERWHHKMKMIIPVTAEDGSPRSFYTYRISFERMCRCIAKYPGVQFTESRSFFSLGDDVVAKFQLNGHEFKIETIWADTHVCPADDVSSFSEIVEIQKHVEQNGPSLFQRWWIQLFSEKERKMPTRA